MLGIDTENVVKGQMVKCLYSVHYMLSKGQMVKCLCSVHYMLSKGVLSFFFFKQLVGV